MKKIFKARIVSALFSEQKFEEKFRGNWTTQQEFQESQGCTDAARKVSGSNTHYILMNWWMRTAVTCGYLVRLDSRDWYISWILRHPAVFAAGLVGTMHIANCRKLEAPPVLFTWQRIPKSMASGGKMIVKVVGGIMACLWKDCGKWRRIPQ
jgi:hypothetical protein